MAGDDDTAAQLRYMATVRRQSAPPRCNPFVIVLQVLALGMVFIGVTMTLIAHWPGSTSIGENPLKVAGPVLLAVGLAALIVGIVLVCIVNRRERRRWQKQMAKIIISRSNADLVGMNDEGAMRANAAPMATHPAQQPATQSRPISGTAGGPGRTDRATASDNMVTDADAAIPMPVRVPKARRPKDQSGDVSMSSTENLEATASEGDAELTDETKVAPRKKRRRPPKAAAAEGEGENEALMTGARPAADVTAIPPSPGEARRLKVHIKAQPGASVRIQNAPPPVAPKPAYRSKPHDTSTETDI